MAHLTIVEGPEATKRLPIEKDRVVVGRAETADIRLADRKASASHCRIERVPSGGYRINDLESQNGTWLNGKRIRRHALKAGDVIGVGTTELRFDETMPKRAKGRRKQRAEKALEDLEQAFLRFVQVAGHDEREQAVVRLRRFAQDLAQSLADPEVARLRKLVSWIRRLTTERDLPKLLSLMLDSVVELTGAERGFLLLQDGGAQRIRVARNFDLDALRKPTFKVARAVAETVSREGQPIVSTSAEEDPRIRSLGDTGVLYLRSVACVPIRSGPRPLGALYLDNRFERGVFDQDDLPFLLSFADQAAIAIENARLTAEALEARQEVEELNRILKGRVEEQEAALHEATTLYAQVSEEARTRYSYDRIVGESPAMRQLFFLLDRVTDSDVPVYLHGESGSGKELAARAIHFNGPRQEGPFVSENCAAVPETLFESEFFGYMKGAFTGAAADKKGLFQLADQGTLFLDEVAELPVPMQAKLLRVLQEKKVRPVGGKRAASVDVRLITASNRNLAEQVRKGLFREDLFHRIHVIDVEIPPLRRRGADLKRLVDHFLARIADDRGDEAPRAISAAALDLLQRYDWPGNVRQLENEILRAYTLSDARITPECLSDEVRAAAGSVSARFRGRSLKEAVREAAREVERELITEALRLEQGNKSAAARRLGVSRPTLDAKIEGLKIPRHPA